MQCMKCGKKTEENQVFCESCLQVMDAYPVKPDTAIHLPNRNLMRPYIKGSHRKKAVAPEVQIARLKKTIRRLRIFSAILVLLFGLAAGYIVYSLTQPKQEEKKEPGQQFTYSSADDT